MINHLAIIMDGNGRWAKNKGLDRIEGHKKGEETFETICKLVWGCGHILGLFYAVNPRLCMYSTGGLFQVSCKLLSRNVM